MRQVVVVGTAALAGLAGLYCWSRTSAPPDIPVQRTVRVVQPAPLCPWRNPESDLQHFFPGATGWETETRILSGRRLELQRLLGRWPEPDENSLRVYGVFRDGRNAGAILTRRVKGEHGAIELVLALNNDATVRGVALQRLREPESVARALLDPAWLDAFSGKSLNADWRLGQAVPEVPAKAAPSARSIVEGVRGLLVLNSVAEHEGVTLPAHH